MTDRISTDELRTLLGEATQGPWVKDRYQSLKSPAGILVGVWGSGLAHMDRSAETEANARLIAAVPDLAAEVIRLRERVAELERFVPLNVVECRGDKCREPWCASCFGWDYAEAFIAALNHKETDDGTS